MTRSRSIVRPALMGGLLLGFLAIGVLTVVAPRALVAILIVDAVGAVSFAIAALCELRPVRRPLVLGPKREALRDLRRALDELPETPHPLGL